MLLDVQEIVLTALDHGQKLGHRSDFLALLLEEPVEKLLAHQLAFFSGELDELHDLFRDALLLRERERYRGDRVRKLRMGRRLPE